MNPAQRVRTDYDPGENFSQHRGKLQPLENFANDSRRHEDGEQLK